MTEIKMILMKPHPDACQVCAREHDPHLPHDQQSLYYQMTFYAQNGRYPTWADAMAHCAPEVKRIWTLGLAQHGIQLEETNDSNN